MFNRNNNKQVPVFTSRAEAFDYMFAEMCDRGADLSDAAKRADEFADIISKNRALPSAPEKQKNVVEKCVVFLQQVSVIKKENPEIWNLATGALGGLIGAFAGAKAVEDDHDHERDVPPPPDFNNIE